VPLLKKCLNALLLHVSSELQGMSYVT